MLDFEPIEDASLEDSQLSRIYTELFTLAKYWQQT